MEKNERKPKDEFVSFNNTKSMFYQSQDALLFDFER